MPVTVCAFLTAFSGIVYEFALAQSLSVLLGNSMLQYALTIGLFLAAMGAGAFAVSRDEPRGERRLLRLQVLLAVLAPAGFIALWAAAFELPRAGVWVAAGTLVSGVGYLTGAELPLLMNFRHHARLRVLAADYFGMLAAAIAFPLFLLPRLGIFGSFLLASALNACVAQVFAGGLPRHLRIFLWILPVALILMLIKEESIRQWLSHHVTSA
ncbi:MAG: hypothetical protein HC902_03600 [Calothrix sp. SM1_5_4]|nr:hypothetical protein [Calothrix sp. SM1_5_4]